MRRAVGEASQTGRRGHDWPAAARHWRLSSPLPSSRPLATSTEGADHIDKR